MHTPTFSHGDFEKAREAIHRQMLSAVSHDLKTPLSTIIGSLEIYNRMNDRLSEEKKMMLIKSALGEAYRLDNFITNILDMAKLEGGMVEVQIQRHDLTSLLQDCITRLGPRVEKATIHLNKTGANGSSVNTDAMLLGRAANLLLDNALKHGVRNPIIHVDYGSEPHMAYIRVRDNGPGIPKGKEDEIFSKYTRFSITDQRNAGTGLGLAICKQIMIIMSGSVTVENHPEGGAIFTLRVPTMH